ncbi:hypothetical protein H2201_003233 [Coniosporium apollinis]|uniref:Uncharacterized protein n=1 Tax=Coniosporium apollinis TaxID=61459 RepID=A0ABQ9NZ61_9PEZI|nr:hypothetical protein H2201_003233 [Coniosporium apollinis]
MGLNFDWPPFDAHEGFMDPTDHWSPCLDMHERGMQTPFASASGSQPTHASSELHQGNFAPDCGSAGAGLRVERLPQAKEARQDPLVPCTPQPLAQAIQAALATLDNVANPPNLYICFVPGCKKNQFTRDADL